MRALFDPPETVDEVAASWFARSRSGGFTADEQHALDAWLAEDPHHATAFEACRQTWAMLEGLRATPEILAVREEVRAMARPRWPIAKAAAMAAAIALAVGVPMLLSREEPEPQRQFAAAEPATAFATGVGQVSRMSLPDGSEVSLDADSVLALHFSGTRRDVTLQKGRAFFHVAHEERPFVVTAGRFSVQATGTRFVVDRVGAQEKVSMVEGRVIARALAVRGVRSPVALVAGRELVDDGHGGWRVGSVDPASAQDWISGRLSFHQERVADVVEVANRYSQRKVIVADDQLGDARVSAVLKAGDTDTLVASLVDVGVARVATRGADAIVLATP